MEVSIKCVRVEFVDVCQAERGQVAGERPEKLAVASDGRFSNDKAEKSCVSQLRLLQACEHAQRSRSEREVSL